MNGKWVLKKDLPKVEKSTIGRLCPFSTSKLFMFGLDLNTFTEKEMESRPDWFEFVPDKPVSWRADLVEIERLCETVLTRIKKVLHEDHAERGEQ